MAEESDHKTQPRRSKLGLWIGLGLTLLVLVAIGGAIVLRHSPKPDKPISSDLLKDLTFQIYYPYHLPAGYRVNPQSIQRQGKVLIFAITKVGSGKSIAVTEEIKPTDINFEQATPHPLPTDKNFFTPIGHATISQWGAKTVSSLVTDQTWIILNVTGIPPAEAQAVTSSFIKL